MTEPLDLSSVSADNDVDRGRLLLRYMRATGQHVQYVRATDSYLISSGAAWRQAHLDDLKLQAVKLSDELLVAGRRARMADVERGRPSPASTKTSAERAATALRKLSNIKNAVELLRVEPGVVAELDSFDADPDVLGVRNGVVNLRTGELRPYAVSDRITRVVDVDYSPDAEAPTWDRFLRDTFVTADGQEDDQLRAFAQRLIGYGITGQTREQKLPVLYGHGGTGKGTFLNTLERLFRPITAVKNFAIFEAVDRPSGSAPQPEIVSMAGVRLVMASEGKKGAEMNAALLKRLTGGDPITARDLFKGETTFLPQFLILLATNHKPEFDGIDSGVWRRVVLVPFLAQHAAEDIDDELGDKLDQELAGILAWAVRGAVAWYSEGLQVPDAVTDATEAYREEQHPLADFIDECAEVTGDQLDAVWLKDFTARYAEWAEGSRVVPVTTFPRSMRPIVESLPGVTGKPEPRTVKLRGIRLLTVAEQAARELEHRRALVAVAT